MRILFNALSTTNLSGRYVLIGHLANLAKWTLGKHQYTVLYHKTNREICQDLGDNVKWVECPGYTANWKGRVWWEQTALTGILVKLRIDFMFVLSGAVIPFLKIPQMSYAMNPVPLINGLGYNTIGSVKLALQRMGYKKAMRSATMMFFLSEYMRQIYRKNAGIHERASEVAYAGIKEETFKAADCMSTKIVKKPFQVITVSVMAPHKGIEILIEAIYHVKRLYKVPVQLLVVGPWPDKLYENKIYQLVEKLNLKDVVDFKGYTSQEDLYQYYAESRLFCLMSRSESFGIPAVEAQVFGIPVVSSNCCAVPEVCGKGGIYREPDDIQGVALEIFNLLTDDNKCDELSEEAKLNAERFRWEKSSRPLMRMFDVIANGNS